MKQSFTQKMYCLLIILLLIQVCNTYFIASKSNIFSITENDTSYFGYSLQLQNELSGRGRIIVGAPRTNSRKNKIDDQNGVVYSCSIYTKKCEEIPLEQNESQMKNIGLGSALDAEESEDGRVVTCAPRWGGTTHNSTKGMCFLLKNNTLENKLYPLKNIPSTIKDLYYSQFGQVGFSAHLIKNQEHSLILGSPGTYSWTGTLAQYSSLDEKEESKIATPNRADNKIKSFSYFGYSTSAGRFNASNPNQIFYVSGAPRNKDLYGSVNVLDPFKNEPFKDRYMFHGTQFGEYFGASIIVGKLDTDNLDDIVIGAPTHSTDTEDDIGCIYVFQAVKSIDKTKLGFNKYEKIVGDRKGSKFGFALSYLGDINKDGFGDIAVGAPYYDNYGAVYIYFGNAMGLKTDYKQKILASVIDKSLRGFGYSLSRGLDIDNNTNNDLAVGAYISGHVALLISRPIIKIQTKMNVDQGSQLNINTTNLPITYCLIHETDMRLPSNNINLTFSIMNTNQVTFENKNYKWTHIINIQGRNNSCGTFKILVIGQILSGINLHMDYTILSTSSEEKFKPLEEQHSPTTLQIPFNKGCSSNICKPNLKLTTVLPNMETNWIIGTPQNLQLVILLENTEEPSFSNKLIIQVTPEYLKFSSFPNYCDQSNNIINCNFKDAILKHKKKNINFELDATKLEIDDTKIILNSTIISDKDTDTSDNTNIMEIPLKTDVNFKISPKSQPDEISNLTGIQTLSHQYNIENVGVTHVKYLKLNFLIPHEIKQREFLPMTVTGCSETTILEEFISTNNENNELILDFPTDNSLFINCTSLKGDHVKCKKIECVIIDSLSSFSINITMMIDSNLIGELHSEGPIILSTTLEPDFKYISTSSHIWTKLVNKQQTASITIHLIIGILLSLLLVFILIFILYKCGFFTKRKLPDVSDHENLLEKELEISEPQT